MKHLEELINHSCFKLDESNFLYLYLCNFSNGMEVVTSLWKVKTLSARGFATLF